MAALRPALAYLYTYDGITGKLSSERVRVPGEHPPLSPLKSATAAGAQSATVRTLDKDVPLLVEVVHVGDGDGDVVYFAARSDARRRTTPDSSDTEDDPEDEGVPARRARAVQQALRTVLEVELLARQLEEQLTCVDDVEEDEGAEAEQVVNLEGQEGGEEEDGNDGEEVEEEAVGRNVQRDDGCKQPDMCKPSLRTSCSTVRRTQNETGRNTPGKSHPSPVNRAFNDM
ncbi:hypothetical protein FKP32DRAFT_1593865 [Trametes sanguinea]|nr:hypothetical protein FKP32DRAFT_1593865 [Trametes sanguinea]